jgi:hypothetical protein
MDAASPRLRAISHALGEGSKDIGRKASGRTGLSMPSSRGSPTTPTIVIGPPSLAMRLPIGSSLGKNLRTAAFLLPSRVPLVSAFGRFVWRGFGLAGSFFAFSLAGATWAACCATLAARRWTGL